MKTFNLEIESWGGSAKNQFIILNKFEEKLYEWIEEFRDQSISSYLGEGISIITNAFKEHATEIDKFIKQEADKDSDALNISNLASILPKIFSIIEVRLLCLDHIVPKDDSALIKESEEQEYFSILVKVAQEHGVSDINPDIMKDLILSYLKWGSAKYSFAHLPNFNEGSGLDPYADLGEVAPGESAQLHKTIRELRTTIENKIEQATEEGNIDKLKILRKIKQLIEIRKHAHRVSEEESIDLMIQDFQKQLDELEPPEAEGEENNDGEGEGDNIVRLQIPQLSSRSSQHRDEIEERRTKGLKEIFDYYAKSQMMIGK